MPHHETKTAKQPEIMLWLDDHRGQYIPRDFANSFADRAQSVTGVTAEDWATLEAGPDVDWYWEAWANVIDNATIRSQTSTAIAT